MSSTNRSDARDSHIADYYITPQKPIEAFLTEFCKDEWIDLSSQSHSILDPCAGWDYENDMSYPAVLFKMWVDYNKIITNDIREDSPAQTHIDFLETQYDYPFDIVITNPPFNIAQHIIEKSLSVVKEWGYVIMLLRLNYIGSKSREEFWKRNKPYAIYAHNKRMSFTADWGTDSIEYGHFIWRRWYNPDTATFKILFS